MTRIKLCFDFLISLISSGPRYGVIFPPWHDILFWAMTAVCRRFGDGGRGGGTAGIVAGRQLRIIRLAVCSATTHHHPHPPSTTLCVKFTRRTVDILKPRGVLKKSRRVCSVGVQTNLSMSLYSWRFIILAAKWISLAVCARCAR